MEKDFPLRLQILRALTAELGTITPENGYVNDLSGAVFRGRIYYGDNDPLPMISILEPPLPTDPTESPWTGTKQLCKWDLLIQGFVDDDPKNPTDPSYVLLADVRKALAVIRAADGKNLGVGSVIRNFDLGNPVVRPSDDISARAYFYLPLHLIIAEDLASPYL
jgi:hypothetical protein